MSLVPARLRSWAAIDLAAMERNLKAIRTALPPHLRYVSVVKADAYGHGLAPVVTRLMRSRADAFAVANLEEAARLREVGTGWPILVLSALLPVEYAEVQSVGATPVVSSLQELEGLAGAAAKTGRPVGIHIKIDTGMGRLGVWYPDFIKLLEKLEELPLLRLEGVCTHFSSADSDPEFTALQRQRFLETIERIPDRRDLLVHADNSAGLESFPAGGAFNAARIGLLQFGVRPKPGSLLRETLTEPVLSFHCRVGLVKELPAGAPVSYGQTHRLTRTSRLAVLTAGYADGVPTALSNKGSVIIGGRLCPIVGRVTMDQTIADVTELPATPSAGDIATFIGRSPGQASGKGEEILAETFAAWAGRIPWEIFCSISPRTRRVYTTDSAV